jgi:transcriptional regulator with XRE-family HTH domain
MPTFSPSRLRRAREAAGLRTVDLAAVTRLSHGTILNWEAGRAKPTADPLAAVAVALGVRVDDLFDGVDR